jgi:hypothetical protein
MRRAEGPFAKLIYWCGVPAIYAWNAPPINDFDHVIVTT